MATKTEDRMKTVVKEYMDEKKRDLEDYVLGVFIWGLGFGVILTYMSILPLIIGIIIGIFIGKKYEKLVDFGMQLFMSQFEKLKLG